MSIQEISLNFKRFLREGDLFFSIVVITVGIASFFLGRASVSSEIEPLVQRRSENTVIQAESDYERAQRSTASAADASYGEIPQEGGYVASKNGTKYHLPWCSGAVRIKEENKVWFATKEEAEKAGYAPAANCKGI